MFAVADQPVAAEPFPAEPVGGVALTEPERRLMEWFYVRGCSVEWIAEVSMTTEADVRRRLSVARSKLIEVRR